MNRQTSPNTPNFGGRRVNKMPLVLVVIVLLVFTLTVSYVAIKRGNNQQEEVSDAENTPSNTTGDQRFALDIIPSSNEYVEAPPPQDPTGTEKEDNPAADPQGNGDIREPVPITEDGTNPDILIPQIQIAQDEATLKSLAKEKLRRLQKAQIAPPGDRNFKTGKAEYVSNKNGRTHTAREQMLEKIEEARRRVSGDKTLSLSEAFQQKKALLGLENSVFGIDSETDSNLAIIGTDENSTDWELDSKINTARTRYTLRAGAVIPATLVGGANSDLPGYIIAQVNHNVYDTATGQYRLIPQGTKLLGQYVSEVSYGQERLMIAWNRLTFPDGRTLDIGGMPGTDSAGYAGFKDKVNNHYFRIFGNAILLSGVTALITEATGAAGTAADLERPFTDTLSESLARNIGETATELIKKNINISPTIEIRPGYRFNVVVTKDFVLENPY